MKIQFKILFFVLLLLGIYQAEAQRSKPPKVIQNAFRHTSIGLGGGSSHYLGEMALYKYPLQAVSTMVRWNGMIDYTRHTSPWFATRLAFSWVRLAGSDYAFGKKNLANGDFARNYIRNLHFRNDVKELSLVSILNIVEQDKRGYLKRDRIIPYLFAGISLFQHAPKALNWELPAGDIYDYAVVKPTDRKVSANWESLNKLAIGTEGQGVASPKNNSDVYPKKYLNIQAAVPLGTGLRIKLGSNFDFSIEAGLTITSTKYLDDLGGKYPNPLDLTGGQTAYPLAPLPAGYSFYPLTNERLLANPSRTITDGYFGKDRMLDLQNIDIAFGTNYSQFRDYSSNDLRGSTRRIPDSFLTFKVKLNYIIGKKVSCPPIK